MSDTWIALDFETATRERRSACSLGIAVIETGVITETRSWLIQPPGNAYEPMNTRVHGIDEDHTAQSPTFDEIYDELWPYLDSCQVIAHWADFDISVLRASIEHYRLTPPSTRYVCSCRMAQRAFPRLRDHRLPTVCLHCGIPLVHHDAASDALACAHVALRCRNQVGVATITEAVDRLGVRTGSL
jgi:DNA polymerase III subunit epsilon